MLQTLLTATRPWKALLAITLVSGAAVRVWLALNDHGIDWPDEVYQSLEPAHRMAFGYSMVAWEFVVGARNVLFPGLIALVLKALALVHLDQPTFYVPLIRIGFALSSGLTALGVYRLARAVGCSLPSAVVGAAALSWMSVAIYFSARAMSEVASALPLTWGLALLLETPTRRKLVLGASLLGLAVLLRIHCGLFAVGALATLLIQRRTRDAGLVVGVLAGWALVYGLLDLVAWGGFFHSALLYLRFNVVEGRAAEWGIAPPAFYTKHLVRSLGAQWVVLAVLGLVGVRRATPVVVLATLFFLGHLALPHKELRFIVPMLPLLCAAAAAGVEQVLAFRQTAGVVAMSAILVTSLVSALTFHSLTMKQVGRYDDVSAYDVGGPLTRLLMQASTRDDLCGLGLVVGERGKTFAYFALHRDVPLYEAPLPARERRFFNYVIAAEGTEAGTVIATDHEVSLVRIDAGPCVKDPSFEPWLDERTRSLAHGPTSLLR